jgi:hypothetical protein
MLFKTGQIATGQHGPCAARFSKENCSSAAYLPDFKTGEIAPCWFSKAACATLIILDLKEQRLRPCWF